MLEDLIGEFRRRFDRPPEAVARAPGRVNLIGEHTDYNDGLVLPLAIDRETLAAVAARSDGRVRVFSRETAEEAEFEVESPVRADHWSDYVKGVCWALAERGAAPRGFDLAVASSVPPESGLSSSAALELAVVTVLDALWELGLDGLTRSRVAHDAESGFVGVACGLMDQLACGLGRRDAALRIDCRSLDVREVPLPSDRVSVLISHSGVRRALAAGGYAERRRECAEALRRAQFVARDAGAPRLASLRDVVADTLPALARTMPPRLLRRMRHVVEENARVDATCRALSLGDFAAAGDALRAGMRSLRDDFEVSTPELDALCEIADAHRSVHGSRLTGAGFGGCVVHLVAAGAEDEVARIVADGFEARFGRRPPIFAVAASDGASLLTGSPG